MITVKRFSWATTSLVKSSLCRSVTQRLSMNQFHGWHSLLRLPTGPSTSDLSALTRKRPASGKPVGQRGTFRNPKHPNRPKLRAVHDADSTRQGEEGCL